MAQYIGRRRTLASSDANPPPAPRPAPPPTSSSSSSSSSTTKTKSKILDPTKPICMPNHFRRLNPSHHEIPKRTNPNPTVKDIHMQAKSMTLSADSASIIKPEPRYFIKGEIFLPKKESFPEKKPPKDFDGYKLQKQKAGPRKKDLLGPVTASKEFQGKAVEPSRMSLSSLLGRRRSLDGSRVGLGDILANCGVRIVSVDMPPFMQIHAVDFARKTHDSLEKFSSKALALSLKKEFDGAYGPAWHCIVGTSFGSFVTHSVGGFLYFSMDQRLYFLLFKTTVQRAD